MPCEESYDHSNSLACLIVFFLIPASQQWFTIITKSIYNLKDELFNMTWAWDKENIWVPNRNQTHDLLSTWKVLYPLSCKNSWGARSFNWVHMWRTVALVFNRTNMTHTNFSLWQTSNSILVQNATIRWAIEHARATTVANLCFVWFEVFLHVFKLFDPFLSVLCFKITFLKFKNILKWGIIISPADVIKRYERYCLE